MSLWLKTMMLSTGHHNRLRTHRRSRIDDPRRNFNLPQGHALHPSALEPTSASVGTAMGTREGTSVRIDSQPVHGRITNREGHAFRGNVRFRARERRAARVYLVGTTVYAKRLSGSPRSVRRRSAVSRGAVAC